MKPFMCLVMGIVFTVLISGLIFPASSKANVELQTCEVPGDYTLIQDAVNAPECSLVNVGDGIFAENITVTRTVTIQGKGLAKTIIDGNGIGDVFTIQATTEMSQSVAITVTLSELTITNGDYGIYSEAYNENWSDYGGEAIHLDIVNCAVDGNSSGGIRNYSGRSGYTDVRVDNCTISGNSGVGIENSSSDGASAHLEVAASTISKNSGFGIVNRSGLYTFSTLLRVENSFISGNKGGISNCCSSYKMGTGQLQITNSTISGNSSESEGGGIANYSSATVLNSTISGNIATQGGGIYTACGHVNLSNSTLSGNGADSGGNLYLFGNPESPFGCSGWATVNQSIVANSSSGGDCQIDDGLFFDEGYNIVEDGSCITSGTSSSGDPMLGPLQDNGGRTLTHALLSSSPAMDTGDNATCPDTDQRGYPRPVDGDKNGTAICDIGAFEYIKFTDFAYLPTLLK